MVLAGSVKMEIIVRNTKVFFSFASEVFSPTAKFSNQNGYIQITCGQYKLQTNILNCKQASLGMLSLMLLRVSEKFATVICKKNPIRLGGTGVIVQSDESCFSHKPKHHRGRYCRLSIQL